MTDQKMHKIYKNYNRITLIINIAVTLSIVNLFKDLETWQLFLYVILISTAVKVVFEILFTLYKKRHIQNESE